jgi:hypothetical protein
MDKKKLAENSSGQLFLVIRISALSLGLCLRKESCAQGEPEGKALVDRNIDPTVTFDSRLIRVGHVHNMPMLSLRCRCPYIDQDHP